MIGLPHTNSRLLLGTVLALVLACLLGAANALAHFVERREVGSLVEGTALVLLGFGLWRLNRFARGACVFLLWCIVIVLPLGIFNPFMMADMAAKSRSLDLTRALLLIVPIVALSLGALHVLAKHKAEFGKRPNP